MGSIVSFNSYDHKPYTVVPVIASFDSEGHIKPLYVRIEGEARKVESYWVRYSFANQMEFNCKIIIDDYLQPVLLTYYQNECMWMIQQPPR